jgi:LDH2 family malate/lactate/ureidoglycolate dehydrogenase
MAARVEFGQLRDFIARAFAAVGMPPADAVAVAALMAQADLQGSDGHGVIRLPQYVRRIRAGGVNLHPDIRIVRERAGMALVNGDNGMGHLVMKRAAAIAVEKAKVAGSAWVGAQWSNHAGPASLYAPHGARARHDRALLRSRQRQPPSSLGRHGPLFSTNPIAAAIPAGREAPIVLDMATTVAAYGKVKAKAARGEMMPEGWMIDREGRPLTDPKRAEEGFLLPIGGYKGYGLALVVGLLAGTLNHAAMGRDVIDFNHDDASATNTGQAIVVIDPAAFGDLAQFKAAVDELVASLHASTRMPGVDRVRVPGERSEELRRAQRREGIAIAPGLLQTLDRVAGDLGIAPLPRI